MSRQGRHLSFARAAEELFISQAAVSHHIKSLESIVGFQLFIRGKRGSYLTDKGKELLAVLTKSLDQIDNAIKSIQVQEPRKRLTVATVAFFGARWLSPRLKYFIEQNPEVQLSFYHTYTAFNPEDPHASEIDLAIQFDKNTSDQIEHELLFPAPLTPICSPGLIRQGENLESVNDLLHYTLLHIPDYGMWEQWISGTSITVNEVQQGIIFDDYNMMLQSAINGQGIGLAIESLVERELNEGQLVKPIERIVVTEYAYYLLYRHETINRQVVQRFRDWLFDQINT